jgi:hypothetical protein
MCIIHPLDVPYTVWTFRLLAVDDFLHFSVMNAVAVLMTYDRLHAGFFN